METKHNHTKSGSNKETKSKKRSFDRQIERREGAEMALDPLTVGLGDGPPGDDDEERAPGDDSPEVPLATSTAAAAAGSLAAVNAASANHESLVSGSSLAAILSANEAAGAKDGKEESEGNDGADDAGDDSVQAILARKRKLLLSMLDGAGSGNDEASPASKRMAAPASTDTSASSFSAIAGWEKQWTPEGYVMVAVPCARSWVGWAAAAACLMAGVCVGVEPYSERASECERGCEGASGSVCECEGVVSE